MKSAISVWDGSSQIVMAACSEWYTPDELFAANCTTDYYLDDKRLYRVPNFLPISVQVRVMKWLLKGTRIEFTLNDNFSSNRYLE